MLASGCAICRDDLGNVVGRLRPKPVDERNSEVQFCRNLRELQGPNAISHN